MALLPKAVVEALSPTDIITEVDQIASYTTDWTGRFIGRADAVVRPRTAEQTAAAVSALSAAGFAIQIQGGNTGLVGGSVPPGDHPGPICVITTTGLQRTDAVDTIAGSLVAGAGVTLSRVQQAAAKSGWQFGVDLAARESATVGGLVATNAGGVRVCAFGMMRENVTGVEMVLANGTIVSSIDRPPKNNVGLAIPTLAVGSEGTLGVITAARLKLARPFGQSTLVAVPADSLQSALDTLTSVTQSGAVLLAAEYCDERTNRRVLAHSGLPTLFATQPPVVLFLEVVGRDLTWQPDDAAKVAQDAASQRTLWAYREQASDSWTAAGDVRKLDVSLPLSRLADFHSELVGLLEGEPAVIEHGSFGHLADGNLHIEVLGLEHTDVAIDGKVLALVASYGGSISAEHGIGRAKSPFLHLAHDAATLNLMRSVRHVFDPRGVLNPGVIFPATD